MAEDHSDFSQTLSLPFIAPGIHSQIHTNSAPEVEDLLIIFSPLCVDSRTLAAETSGPSLRISRTRDSAAVRQSITQPETAGKHSRVR